MPSWDLYFTESPPFLLVPYSGPHLPLTFIPQPSLFRECFLLCSLMCSKYCYWDPRNVLNIRDTTMAWYIPVLTEPTAGGKSWWLQYKVRNAFQVLLVVKNFPANAGDIRDSDSIPGLRSSPGEGNGNPLQYSCLENPMDRGAWQATAQRIAQSRTWQEWLSTHA